MPFPSPLPNHWHALATIWACQAGKDVYVEKPASHNVFESRQMVAAARKYKRMVQVGSQSRSVEHKIKAMQTAARRRHRQGVTARAACASAAASPSDTRRTNRCPQESIGTSSSGPAQMKPYSQNKFDYNWHWFWDTGNGDIGNQGVHEMDIALWGLDRPGLAVEQSCAAAASTSGRTTRRRPTRNRPPSISDDGAQMTFDVRNLPTPPEGLVVMRGPNYVGNIFFGDLGFLVVDHGGFRSTRARRATSPAARLREAPAPTARKLQKGWTKKANDDDSRPAHENFFAAVRSRDYTNR